MEQISEDDSNIVLNTKEDLANTVMNFLLFFLHAKGVAQGGQDKQLIESICGLNTFGFSYKVGHLRLAGEMKHDLKREGHDTC